MDLLKISILLEINKVILKAMLLFNFKINKILIMRIKMLIKEKLLEEELLLIFKEVNIFIIQVEPF
jgi:hypothetical protein